MSSNPLHRILDGHFFTYVFVVKICNVFENTKINEKEAGVGLAHFYNDKNLNANGRFATI